jgi:cytoskeletal protein CcmA (bactofilin family)
VRNGVRARSWTLTGRAKVTGPVELDVLTVRGDLSVAGPVRTDRWDAVGRTLVDGLGNGNGAWQFRGESRFGGPVTAGSLKVDGRLDVKGALTLTGDLAVTGSLDVLGDLKAGAFRFDGAASVSGTVHAQSFHAVVRGVSKMTTVNAPQVVVERKVSPFDRDPPMLELLEIEAQEVRLTGVKAQYVKAPRITIGPGCRIAQVEGTVVARDARSHVGPQIRSKLPYGLTR